MLVCSKETVTELVVNDPSNISQSSCLRSYLVRNTVTVLQEVSLTYSCHVVQGLGAESKHSIPLPPDVSDLGRFVEHRTVLVTCGGWH